MPIHPEVLRELAQGAPSDLHTFIVEVRLGRSNLHGDRAARIFQLQLQLDEKKKVVRSLFKGLPNVKFTDLESVPSLIVEAPLQAWNDVIGRLDEKEEFNLLPNDVFGLVEPQIP